MSDYPMRSAEEFAGFLIAHNLLAEEAWYDPEGWDGGIELERVYAAVKTVREHHEDMIEEEKLDMSPHLLEKATRVEDVFFGSDVLRQREILMAFFVRLEGLRIVAGKLVKELESEPTGVQHSIDMLANLLAEYDETLTEDLKA